MRTINFLLFAGIACVTVAFAGDATKPATDDPIFAAVSGDPKTVESVLKANAKSANAVNAKGETPLHVLANRVVMELDLKSNFGGEMREHGDPNELAAAKLLVANGADINAKTKENDQTPLQISIARNKSDFANFLIEKGADVKAVDKDGATALLWAVNLKNAKLAVILIEKGADVNREGQTALHVAAYTGDAEVVKLLLSKGANQTLKTKHDKTPMDYAVMAKQQTIIELLQNPKK